MVKVLVVNIFTALIWLGTGIACLVVTQNNPSCGVGGSPPLWAWEFGAGIAYVIIGGSGILFAIVNHFADSKALSSLFVWVLALSSAFTFAWAIVGAVTLAQHATDCQQFNYPVYAMGLGAVIITWITWACFSIGTVYTKSENQN